jgi:hypothetical protein
MYKTLSILFLTASMAQAQTTLLCEDDFTTRSNFDGCNISKIRGTPLQRLNNVLQYQHNGFYQNNIGSINVSFNKNLSEYDTVKLEMDFSIMGPNYFNSNQFQIQNSPNPIQFNYTDVSNNKSYTGSMYENPKPVFTIMLPGISNTYTSNKLITKVLKPTGSSIDFMTLMAFPPIHEFSTSSWGPLNPMIAGTYEFDIYQDPTFFTKIKQAFCASTGNPTDCQTKVNVFAPPMPPIRFEIDNFKAYGIKKVITGLEEEIKLLNTRSLVGMYNSLGQKLNVDQMHEGLVIKMYSDGTKEKVVMK